MRVKNIYREDKLARDNIEHYGCEELRRYKRFNDYPRIYTYAMRHRDVDEGEYYRCLCYLYKSRYKSALSDLMLYYYEKQDDMYLDIYFEIKDVFIDECQRIASSFILKWLITFVSQGIVSNELLILVDYGLGEQNREERNDLYSKIMELLHEYGLNCPLLDFLNKLIHFNMKSFLDYIFIDKEIVIFITRKYHMLEYYKETLIEKYYSTEQYKQAFFLLQDSSYIHRIERAISAFKLKKYSEVIRYAPYYYPSDYYFPEEDSIVYALAASYYHMNLKDVSRFFFNYLLYRFTTNYSNGFTTKNEYFVDIKKNYFPDITYYVEYIYDIRDEITQYIKEIFDGEDQTEIRKVIQYINQDLIPFCDELKHKFSYQIRRNKKNK